MVAPARGRSRRRRQAAVTAYAAGWTAKDLTPVAFADDATKTDFTAAVKDLGDAPVAGHHRRRPA